MLVYGDHKELVRPAERLETLAGEIARLGEMPGGIGRHSALISVLIEAGRLEQAIADTSFAAEEHDRIDEAVAAMNRLTFALAASVVRSWKSGCMEIGQLPRPRLAAGLPSQAALKLPEGYAFYAVYPEAFADAALRLNLKAPPRVIGIRSIGTSLGGVVASALGAPPHVSVRPFGDPFDRRIAVSAELEIELLSEASHFVVVDEGPGLSGSSFGAVADWLEARGVPLERIAFITSHSGAPGPRTQERHRARWAKVQRVAADFGPELGSLVGGWAADLLGSLDAEPLEISGGEWRRLLFQSDGDWPAANSAWERRKFLLRSEGRPFIAKFAGLGSAGERKLRLARRLDGFIPRPIGFVHGFIVEPWLEDRQPLRPGEQPLEEVADYLGARCRTVDRAGPGASLADLLTMAKRNAGLALGDWAERALEHWSDRLASLEQRNAPMCIDGRLDRHEWLRTSDGKLIKTDALDHHESHDLIGCQDLAWDVAGASIEFELSPAQTRWLAAESGRRAARFVDPELLEFLTLAYLAFRVGHASMSAEMSVLADRARWIRRLETYATEFQWRLAAKDQNATRGVSSIGQQPERTAPGTILQSPGS